MPNKNKIGPGEVLLHPGNKRRGEITTNAFDLLRASVVPGKIFNKLIC